MVINIKTKENLIDHPFACDCKVPRKQLSGPKLHSSKINYLYIRLLGFTNDSHSKESACNVRDLDLIPELRRSSGEGNGNPLRILAWTIPWTEDSGRLQCMGLQREKTEELTLSHFHISDFKAYKIFSPLLCVLLSHHYAWLKIMISLSQKRTAQCQQSTLEWIHLFSMCNCPSLFASVNYRRNFILRSEDCLRL